MSPNSQEKVLVVIQLSGGKDGLNTIIAYSDDQYERARPKLAIPRSDVIALDASQGTDHRAAAPAFLSGPRLKQPIIGSQPSLSELDDGDLKFHTDFRGVYSTLIEVWLEAPSKGILSGEHAKMEELGLQS